MRIALVGNHSMGVDLARAFQARADCSLVGLVDGNVPGDFPEVVVHSDLEELLARPDVDLVIVAGAHHRRGLQLRRAMQSGKHVLSVTPAADTPDLAYEAALIQGDTHKLLLPVVPQLLHPAVGALEKWLNRGKPLAPESSPCHRIIRWKQVGRCTPDDPPTPDWFLIRRVAGDLIELAGLAPNNDPEGLEPIVFTGRFQDGSLLLGSMEPASGEASWSLSIYCAGHRAKIEGRSGLQMTFSSSDPDESDSLLEDADSFAVWRRFAEEVIERVKEPRPWLISWQDEIRVCECDEALRLSITQRKIISLDYQEISEEVGSKSTLTLIGCGMVWLMLLLALVAIWQPLVLWGVIPLLLLYLGLLALNWLVRKK